MADFTPRMPSEDEDFDAVAAPVRPRKPRTPSQRLAPKSPVRTLPNPRPEQIARAVAVTTQPDSLAAAEPVADEPISQPAAPASYAQEAYEPEPEPAYEESAQDAPEYVEPLSTPQPSQPAVIKPVKAAKAPKAPKPPRQPGARARHGHLLVEAVLLLLVIGLGIWSWQLYTDRKALRANVVSLEANPQLAVQKQTQTLLTNVSQLITLPTGETPTIANVSDADQARKQSAFFNSAQNGDRVLMYVKAGEAILYRPTTNKIILVAPLTFNADSTAASQKP